MNTIFSAATPGRTAGGMGKLMLGLVVAAAGVLASPAWSQSDAPPPAGMHHPHHRMHGGPWFASPKRMERLLDSVKASDAQKAQIRQIVQSAFADMAAQREAGRSLRQQAMAVFTAPTVDANAAEQVRQQMLAQHDQSSRRMTAAMLEVSRVLTPEQRTQIAERLQRHQKHQRAGRPAERGAPKTP